MIKIFPKDKNGFTNPLEETNKYGLPASLPTIFLAEPCPRKNYENDWRNEAFKYLEEAGYNGIVFSPTNALFNKEAKDELSNQTTWEIEAMEISDKVLFWIPRDKDNPAFTTNIELGTFLSEDRIDKAIIGMPDWAEKTEYIKLRLQRLGKSWYTDLREEINAVVKELDNDR